MGLFAGITGLFQQLGYVGGALAAFAAFAVAIGFKSWGWPRVTGMARGIAGFFRGVSNLGPMVDRMARLETTLDKVYKEVMPNGGSSMRDAMTRTETAITVLINTTRAQWNGMGMFGSFEAHADGNYAYVNNQLQHWVNRSEHEFLGYGWVNSIAPGDRDRVRAEWESCLDDVRDFCLEFAMRRADGHEFPVVCTASPVTEYAGGPVVKWVGVVRRSDQGGA